LVHFSGFSFSFKFFKDTAGISLAAIFNTYPGHIEAISIQDTYLNHIQAISNLYPGCIHTRYEYKGIQRNEGVSDILGV
jgi:hypothetical protein